MKLIALLALAPLTLAASTIQPLGKYAEPTQTFIVGYEDQSSCEADGGQWDTEMEMCFFAVENTVELAEANGKLELTVDTVGSNAHECHFQGEAVKMSETEYVSKVNVTEFEQNDKGEWIEVPAVCEVSMSFLDADSVAVGNNGKCSEFCGARAWLSVDKAIRK